MRVHRFMKFPQAIVIIAIIFSSCSKTDLPAPKPDETNTVNESQLVAIVNDIRQQGCTCGTTYMPPVGTVVWNNILESAALGHAEDMFQKNYFSHTGSDNSSPGDRITRAGYHWRTYGENIAKGYSNEQAVVDAWLESEGHCKNIMNGVFTEMGVAKAGTYWVQEFGDR